MAIQGVDTQIYITGDSTSFTAETMSTTDDQIYTIDDATKDLWDIDGSFTVYDDGVETIEDYTIQKIKGQITFSSADALRGEITVDGDYLPKVELTQAHDASLNLSADLLDDKTFDGVEFTSVMQGQKSASISLSEFYNTNQYLLVDLVGGAYVAVDFYPDRNTTTRRIRMYSQISSDEITSAPTSLTDMSITLESTGEAVN